MSTAYVAPGPLTPILTNGWGEERSWTLDSYRSRGGYQGLEKARTMEPADIVQAVKDSGLRGRGGAGFPSGLKWSFLPPADGGPRYLVVNADESEPGTCKDIPLIMGNPHVLIEGIAITSRAGSTGLPGWAGWPLTVTRPCAIASSALRRDITPFSESTFWMRIPFTFAMMSSVFTHSNPPPVIRQTGV